MKELLKVLSLILGLITKVFDVKQFKQRKAETQAIKRDPRGAVHDHFGGVHQSDTAKKVSSDATADKTD